MLATSDDSAVSEMHLAGPHRRFGFWTRRARPQCPPPELIFAAAFTSDVNGKEKAAPVERLVELLCL